MRISAEKATPSRMSCNHARRLVYPPASPTTGVRNQSNKSDGWFKRLLGQEPAFHVDMQYDKRMDSHSDLLAKV